MKVKSLKWFSEDHCVVHGDGLRQTMQESPAFAQYQHEMFCTDDTLHLFLQEPVIPALAKQQVENYFVFQPENLAG